MITDEEMSDLMALPLRCPLKIDDLERRLDWIYKEIKKLKKPKGETMKLLVDFADGKKVELQGVVKFEPVEEITMNFSEAVKVLSMDHKVRRVGWPKGESIVVVIEANLTKQLGCINSNQPFEDKYYTPTLADLVADDWVWAVND